MPDKIARIISISLNPLIILVLVPFLVVYRTFHSLNSALFWTFYTLIYLLALSLFIFFGVRKKLFNDFDVSNREQRPLLFLSGFICLILYILGLYLLHGPAFLVALALGLLIALVVVSVVNTRIKASIHVATISAVIVALSVDLKGYYLLLLSLIPLVGWARVRERKHNVKEAVTGGIIGSILSLALYFVIGSGFHA